jgi:hypothetical protein
LITRVIIFDHAEKALNRPQTRMDTGFQSISSKIFSLMNLLGVVIQRKSKGSSPRSIYLLDKPALRGTCGQRCCVAHMCHCGATLPTGASPSA